MDRTAELQQQLAGFFPGLLGVRLTRVGRDAVHAELTVREELCTVPGILHGGALMAFADTLGAVGTSLNLAPGQGTTTIESKTNFFAPGRTGATITAECLPLHRGRQTMVWQTSLRDAGGRLLAQVTQTQFVIQPPG
jgi:1,4-dihydroxy-2-naphthoyl-CoA hydrolase